MRDEVLNAALAGLLHDVGKLAQRAGERPSQLWDDEASHLYGYAHALLSTDAALKVLPTQWEGALAGVAGHHRPTTRLARLVAAGDRLSSAEREPSDQAGIQRLRPILTRVCADQWAGEAPDVYVPLVPLTMEAEALFPRKADTLRDPTEEYRGLWTEFSAAASSLRGAASVPGADAALYVQGLLDILERTTWCVPAAAYHAVPDTSLFEHSRMTAALAVCLASQPDSVVERLLPRPEAVSEPVAWLVGGDVSGVQDFIYTVTPRGAASSLRGRSLYLQLLTEASARYLLGVLGLPPTNLVYASGGRFFLLAPPGEDTRAALEESRLYIARVLLRHHAGDLYLALGDVPLTPQALALGRIAAAWGELTQRLRVAKEQRFVDLGCDLHRLLFRPWRDQGNEQAECQVCHHEHVDTCLAEGVRKCPACLAYEDLGDALRRARYVVWDAVQPAFEGDEGPAGGPDDVLRALGAAVHLTVDAPPPAAGPRRVLALSDAALGDLEPGPRACVGRMYLVNVTPDRDGRVSSNDELADASHGIDRLGVLRMDVDDLGSVFSTGLGELASLSRMATLSAAIRRFFEGWVACRAAEHNPRGGVHRVYSIYSGGDDLFFVGSWDALATLAMAIRKDLSRYTAGHPALHISGGLVLVTPHYPLYQAAREAGEAEENAKARPGKDALCFLGRVLPWSDVVRAEEWAARLAARRQAGQTPAALLRLLMRAQEAHEAAERRRVRSGTDRTASGAPQAFYGPWIPRTEYSLVRLAERQRSQQEEILALRTLLREEDFRAIGWIGTAARWAELLTRARGRRTGGA